MRKIFLFMMISLDGCFEGENHDLSWHNVDNEFNLFAVEQLQKTDTILFGRRTYQLMENYWPTNQGIKDDPVVANLMNNTQKIVFSKTLDTVVETATWKNIQLVKDNIKEEIDKIKNQDGNDIAVLGSSNLCITLLNLNLIDEMRLMINPVVVGKGTSLFQGIEKRKTFILQKTKEFHNGNVLLTYTA